MMMRRRMKMAAVSAAALLLLCCFISSTGSQHSCDLTAEVGQTITVPLNHVLAASDRLKWIHGEKVLVNFREKTFITGSQETMQANGTLTLRSLTHSDAGEYKAQVHSNNGKMLFRDSTNVCVFGKVPKPEVKVTCSGSNVMFTCRLPQQVQEISFEWLQDEKLLPAEKNSTLTRTHHQVTANSFKCRVSNPLSKETSAAATQTCSTPHKPAEDSIFPEMLFGFDFWIMASILGGGGGLVLLLMILTAICCRRARRRRFQQLKEEEELRLDWTNQQLQQQQQQQQRHHQQDDHQRPGHTGPHPHRCKLSRDPQRPRGSDATATNPRNPRPRTPAQGAKAADHGDGEQPPPLPQPRKKTPRTPRV